MKIATILKIWQFFSIFEKQKTKTKMQLHKSSVAQKIARGKLISFVLFF